jgi:transposase
MSQPFKEVYPMITHTFQDAFSAPWIKANLNNPTHELVLLRRLIPWQPIIDRLTPFYHPNKGRNGQSLRTTVAVSIVARLRQLSDEKVIEQVQENRYMQYFCNVPDQGLQTFMNPSTLCRFRKRLGTPGIAIIEEEVFDQG